MATFADTFESLYSGKPGETKSPSREDQRTMILKDELSKAQGRMSSATDAASKDRAIRDVDALTKELGRLGVKVSAPTGGSFADTFESLYSGQKPAEPATTAPKQEDLGLAGGLFNRLQQAGKDLGASVLGAGETAAQAISGGLAVPASAVGGVVGALTSGKYGTQAGVQAGQNVARKIQEQMTYQPRTQAGQEMSAALGKAFEASKLPPVGVPELAGMAPLAQPAAQQVAQIPARARAALAEITPAQQLQQQFQAKGGMRSGGAAATQTASELQAAISQATPELAADLRKLKPEEVNMPAVNRQLEADQLPVPVRLTQGQASQNPTLISRERNERGFKDQFVQRLNEQNKALLENANLVKERTAPDVFGPDYVANAQGAIDEIKGKIEAFNQEKKQAYQALEQFGAGKLEVDAQSFANNAFRALTKNEDIDFLPAQIRSKIDAYRDGKPMNFDQFQNLTTQIARETRKAQRADDGNAVHALTLVRNELERLPLLNETAEAKALADKARGLAKREFDLLDKTRPTYNSAYAMVANEGADTANFIQNQILRSKNKDFEKTLGLFGDNPQAVQNLRAGTLDYIIRESTDASGNFLTGKFAKQIRNLDVNKKLDALFGPEDAKTLRSIANVGSIVEARPKGAFVNESNTATAAAQMAKQYGARLLEETPVVGAIVRPATELMQHRKQQKQLKEALRPAAGTKLSDIGKD